MSICPVAGKMPPVFRLALLLFILWNVYNAVKKLNGNLLGAYLITQFQGVRKRREKGGKEEMASSYIPKTLGKK